MQKLSGNKNSYYLKGAERYGARNKWQLGRECCYPDNGGELMLNQTAIYRVSMALKNRDKRAETDLKDLVEDLAGAKDEYNATNGENHRLLLLEPTGKRLNLLFKPGQGQDFELSMLTHFETILRDEFDWHTYCSQDSALLEKKIARPLQREEFKEILEVLQASSNHKLLSDPVIETLLDKTVNPGNNGRNRYRHLSDDEARPEISLEEALQQLDNLVGLESFKTEMKKVVRYISNLNPADNLIPAREIYPYHYLITTAGQGVGLSTALNYMATIYYHLGICPVYGLIEEKAEKRGRFGFHYIQSHDFNENGVCAITGVEHLDEDNRQEIVGELLDEHKERVIVMVIQADQEEAISELQEKLSKFNQPYRQLHLPAYNEQELTEIFKRIIAVYKCNLDSTGAKLLLKRIRQLQQQNSFSGVSTLKEIAGKMIFEIKSGETAPETREELTAKINCYLQSTIEQHQEPAATPQAENPLKQLDSMVGIQTVKTRMHEILSHFIVDKKKAELGLVATNLCKHMIFTGNPGTGKTTVARIIGKILKQEGLLKKGDLIEVGREDLVGRYVGWTAPKTEEIIKKSLGSVLFIDEAYSLDGGHEHDFGHEVLATLVKKMEEHKDELVVILAGYSSEMEKMIALNPGLKSRAPHQIHFADYSADELYLIFEQQLGPEYHLGKEAANKLKELFARTAASAGRHSGNGRFVRNVIERLKMKQSIRLLGQKSLNSQALQKITANDVKALLDDPDLVPTQESKKTIGF